MRDPHSLLPDGSDGDTAPGSPGVAAHGFPNFIVKSKRGFLFAGKTESLATDQSFTMSK